MVQQTSPHCELRFWISDVASSHKCTYTQFLLSMNCKYTWGWRASRSSLHLPLVKPSSYGLTYFKYVRVTWSSHCQGHSTTDSHQMSASVRSCAPLCVVIQNCKNATDAAFRSARFRAINWWKENKLLFQFTYFLNKGFGRSRYLDNESLPPIGLGAYSESNIFSFNIAKQAT